MADSAFSSVIRLFQSGQSALAEAECRRLIAASPSHSDANHLLGVILLQTGRLPEAVMRLEAAVAARSGNYEALSVLAKALAMSGQFERAHVFFEKVARAKPGQLQALADLGFSFSYLGKHEDARKTFARVLAKESRNLPALMGLGQAQANLGQFDQAITSFESADRFYPGRTDILENLAKAYLSARRLDDATSTASRALVLDSGAKARVVLGHVLYMQDRFEEAELELRAVLAKHPKDIEARSLLSALLRRVGRLDEAFDLFAALIGDHPAARFNFGLCLKDMGRLDEAIAEIETAMRATPDSPDLRHCRSLLYLQAGKLEQGWADHAARFDTSVEPVLRMTFPFPALSEEEDISNHTVLVWPEQSIGAQITFGSALPDLIGRAGAVEFLSFPKLKSLFARSFPDMRILDNPEESKATRHMPIGNLFSRFRRQIADFPSGPYLLPDPATVASLRQRLSALGPGIKIGIGWRSTSVNLERQKHFFSSLLAWGPILSIPGLVFVNLQPKAQPEELEAARHAFSCRIEHFEDIDLFDDLDSTAALSQALDLVISNGSANAFLAAAVGTPVWQFYLADAHWDLLGTGDRIPWLPSLVPVQRRWNEGWENAILRIAQALKDSQATNTLIAPSSLSFS